MQNKTSKQDRKQDSSSLFVHSKKKVCKSGAYYHESQLDSVFSNFAGFFMLLGFISAGFYYFLQPSSGRMPASVEVDNADWESQAWNRSQGLQMKQENRARKAKVEAINHLAVEVDNEEVSKPTLPMIDVDPMVSPSKAQSIVDGLTASPFNPDIETPEDIIRRRVAHDKWLENYLVDKNEKERKKFILHFIRSAREQGHEVHFQGGMKFILTPIEKPKEKLEEAKVHVE